MKKILVALIFVATIISTTEVTYAYWNEPQIVLSETIDIGEWEQIFEWEPNYGYSRGNKVIYNGRVYRSRWNNNFIRPETWLGFYVWRLVQ